MPVPRQIRQCVIFLMGSLPWKVSLDGMVVVVVCCGTMEKPSSSVPMLTVLEGSMEIGCEVVVAVGMTDVHNCHSFPHLTFLK